LEAGGDLRLESNARAIDPDISLDRAGGRVWAGVVHEKYIAQMAIYGNSYPENAAAISFRV
jgi:hypothetical protein